MGLALLDEMEDIPCVTISCKEDEEAALAMATGGTLAISFADQEIIPLENLIAGKVDGTTLLVQVQSAAKGKTALETLEIGADGVILETDDPTEVVRLSGLLNEASHVGLTPAKVTCVRELGLGARACIDTCSMLSEGEGMLVGSSSQGMMLVQAEVAHNEFVAPRPFRVNAGALSLYTMRPGDKTAYLEELSAGDSTVVIARDGSTRTAYIARSKIELRPLVLVIAEHDGMEAKAVLQLAETVRLVTANGSIPVTELREGDTIMARFQEGGRHFGMRVDKEEVIEK